MPFADIDLGRMTGPMPPVNMSTRSGTEAASEAIVAAGRKPEFAGGESGAESGGEASESGTGIPYEPPPLEDEEPLPLEDEEPLPLEDEEPLPQEDISYQTEYLLELGFDDVELIAFALTNNNFNIELTINWLLNL